MKKKYLFLFIFLLTIASKPIFADELIITIIPNDINFGSVVVGEQKYLSATIINQTGDDVRADDYISVQNSAIFSVDTVGVLPPYAVRPFSIRFTPLDKGVETGQITLSGGASVSLSGEGIEADEELNTIVLSPESIDFGSLDVGGSRTTTVTVQISATETATISVSLSSNTGGAFSYYNACPALLSGSSCAIDVVFQPIEDGYYASNLLVNDGTSTRSISLKGKGGAIAEPDEDEDEDDYPCFINAVEDMR